MHRRPVLSALLALLALVAPALGCFGTRSGTPEERARAILEEHAGDEAGALAAWRADPGLWRVGLEHEVAALDPLAPLVIRTERDLVTPTLDACLPDSGPVAYRTDVVGADEVLVARFRWSSLDAATAGHARVRAAVAAARGETGPLRQKIAADPVLTAAGSLLAGHPEPCPAPAG